MVGGGEIEKKNRNNAKEKKKKSSWWVEQRVHMPTLRFPAELAEQLKKITKFLLHGFHEPLPFNVCTSFVLLAGEEYDGVCRWGRWKHYRK